MEAPVERIGIFLRTGGTHGKDIHRGGGPIVGKALDDGEARAAVGAVDEGVVVTAVRGVEKLAEAVGAGSDVGRDERSALGARVRGHDGKGDPVAGVAVRACPIALKGRHIHMLNAGGGGGVRAERLHKRPP